MATITEIARRANLPTETVLRVMNGEPTSEDAASRVAAAIEEVGPPDYPKPSHETQPAEIAARGQLLETFQRTAEELRTAIPEGVGSAVVEAVRVEVLPVRDGVGELRSLYDNVISRLARERNERIDDLELVCQLITESWRNADRRLGRIERMLERLELNLPDAAPHSHAETTPSPVVERTTPPTQPSAVPKPKPEPEPPAKTQPPPAATARTPAATAPSPAVKTPPTRPSPVAEPAVPKTKPSPAARTETARSPAATKASPTADAPSSETRPSPVKSPPRATQPSAVPDQAVEICEIVWWRGLVNSQFYAAANGEGGLADAIELSPTFAWRGEGPPDENEEAVAAHRTLLEILRADGWEAQPAEPDKPWYAVRLRREAR